MHPEIEIKQTLDTFYKIISGHKTENRDWETMRTLFYPGATLYPASITRNPSSSHGLDIDAYIQDLDRFLSQNDFFEHGLISQVYLGNNIASVISEYEARHSKNDRLPFKRGRNFIHFLLTKDGWKITSMIWCDT